MRPLVGAVLEAWGEVRVHRSRVVLSLVGVVLAVFAMTIVTAAGTVAQQVVLESVERQAGRTTTLSVNAYPSDGATATPQETAQVLDELVDRFGVQYSSLSVQTGLQHGPLDYPSYLELRLVEPDYGVIHRISPVAGRWLADGDAGRLAPAVVASTRLLQDEGVAGRPLPLAMMLPGPEPLGVTVVGEVAGDPFYPTAYLLPAALERLGEQAAANAFPTLELWVPPESADTLRAEIPGALAARGYTGEAFETSDPGLAGLITAGRWGVRVLALFALGLGALGVLNVGIVTVRQRVREIGVRRALGASSGRVFAAIVLESVVATALAGALGVALAVAVVVNLPLDELLGEQGITDVPGFPVSAAVEAFVASVAVGALAGLVPATIAVRSKVIDAIRY